MNSQMLSVTDAFTNGDLYNRYRESDHNIFSIILETNGFYTKNSFEYNIEHYLNLSAKKEDFFHQAYLKRINERKKDVRLTIEPSTSSFGDFFDQILHEDMEILLNQMDKLLSKPRIQVDFGIFNDLADLEEYKKYQNDFVHIRLYLMKKWDAMSKLFDCQHINGNCITILDSQSETVHYGNDGEIMDSNNKKANTLVSIGHVINMIKEKSFEKRKEKSKRPHIYSVMSGNRPKKNHVKGTSGYYCWSGFQAFDIDMKGYGVDPKLVKLILAEDLKKQPWFVSAQLSTSHTGVHIYTKVCRPDKLFLNEEENERIIEWEYLKSYWYKHAFIWWLLNNRFDEKLGNALDPAMSKISQGIKEAVNSTLSK